MIHPPEESLGYWDPVPNGILYWLVKVVPTVFFWTFLPYIPCLFCFVVDNKLYKQYHLVLGKKKTFYVADSKLPKYISVAFFLKL